MAANNENNRYFETLADVTPADVQWLKDGSEARGWSVYNHRTINYTTKRGVMKSAKCFVFADGKANWKTCTLTGEWKDGLTNEEAAVFAPAIAARRKERADAWKAKKAEAEAAGPAVKVGDIFGGSYGYDATLWNFYEVVRVSKTGKTIWTRELAHETKPGYGDLDWKCRPIPGKFTSEAEKHLVQYTAWDEEPRPYFKQNYCVSPVLLADPADWHDADNYH